MPRKKLEPEEIPVDNEPDTEGWFLLAEVCRRLGCSSRRVKMLAEEGQIPTKQQGDVTYYEESAVEELALYGINGNKRDAVIDQLNAALKIQMDYTKQLTGMVINPVRDIMKVAVEENVSLRGQVQQLYGELRELNELIGELQKATWTAEADAKKQELNVEQRREFMQFFKEKLAPALLDGMTTRKLVGSFSIEQMETFLEAKVLSDEQDSLLRELLKQRKAAAAAKEGKANGTSEHATEPERKSGVGSGDPGGN